MLPRRNTVLGLCTKACADMLPTGMGMGADMLPMGPWPSRRVRHVFTTRTVGCSVFCILYMPHSWMFGFLCCTRGRHLSNVLGRLEHWFHQGRICTVAALQTKAACFKSWSSLGGWLCLDKGLGALQNCCLRFCCAVSFERSSAMLLLADSGLCG
jgi:hypothetical protein